jgi:hypothetical protein
MTDNFKFIPDEFFERDAHSVYYGLDLNLEKDFMSFEEFLHQSVLQIKVNGGAVNFRKDFHNNKIIWVDIYSDLKVYLSPDRFMKTLHILKSMGFRFASAICNTDISKRWMKLCKFTCIDPSENLYSIKL